MIAGTTLILKQPSERIDQALALGGVMAVLSINVVAHGYSPESQPLLATAAISAGIVKVTLAGGTDGERYLVTIAVELADSARREIEIEVAVVDAAWAMPDGGAPYLSIAGFVEMFGLAEVIRMTDAGDGRIDRAYLVKALQAAQGEADIHLSARYVVPLAVAVPEAIRTAIADIARARLYPRGAPEAVATAAKEARQMLGRISEGRLPLPLPAGEIAAPAEEDAPIMFHSGGRSYPDGLADY